MRILKSDKCSPIKIQGHRRPLKGSVRDLYNEAYDYYHGLAKVNWEASGGLTEEIDEARDYMINRGFDCSVLIKSKCKVTYNPSYQVIFPILDNGKFKGWVCRTTKKEIDRLTALGFANLPICMAKTQYSFSDDASKLGAPENFTVTVKKVKVSAGAGFIVVLTGDIMTMPGLPKTPAAEKIDVDENGKISGLF